MRYVPPSKAVSSFRASGMASMRVIFIQNLKYRRRAATSIQAVSSLKLHDPGRLECTLYILWCTIYFVKLRGHHIHASKLGRGVKRKQDQGICRSVHYAMPRAH